MRTIAEYLPEHPFFADIDPAVLHQLVGCAQNVHVPQGQILFRTGDPATTFFVVRRGRVALDVHDPRRGTLTVDSVEAGEVAGWSWLVPPYRWMFDARAASAVSAVALDGACLRRRCDEDTALGYALMQRVAATMYVRLQDARLRLLDVYGVPA